MARKMTSITLIAVMVAGGITVAAPGFVPAVYADHNENLLYRQRRQAAAL